ncbi:MAG TPA: hypothetical protein VGD58_17125 [Herpetosiphonaceae bacterium]
MEEQQRGSSKVWARVFESDAPTDEELTRSLASAGEDYRIKRWWKYGQPAIDRIKATLDVRVDNAGPLVQDLLAANGKGLQVSLDAFPYGIPDLEGVMINVLFEREIQQ